MASKVMMWACLVALLDDWKPARQQPGCCLCCAAHALYDSITINDRVYKDIRVCFYCVGGGGCVVCKVSLMSNRTS